MTTTPITIVLADDDEEDRMLIQEAFTEARVANDFVCVEDGEMLLDYLYRRGKFDGVPKSRPELILLDLNMPKMDGREVLHHLRNDPELRKVPVVVMTTSKSEEDILRTYALGANSFITKPVTFADLVTVTKRIGEYWIEMVTLPPSADYSRGPSPSDREKKA